MKLDPGTRRTRDDSKKNNEIRTKVYAVLRSPNGKTSPILRLVVKPCGRLCAVGIIPIHLYVYMRENSCSRLQRQFRTSGQRSASSLGYSTVSILMIS
jgi:hypothetical protein